MERCLEKRNSQNAVPTTHCWEDLFGTILNEQIVEFPYDLRCIDGDNAIHSFRRGRIRMANDAGLSTQYKPVSVGNRVEGLGHDFVVRILRWFANCLLHYQLSVPMIMKEEMYSSLMKVVPRILRT